MMQAYDITDQHNNRFVRISKRAAFLRWITGKRIVLCPVKLHPGYPWSPHMPMPDLAHELARYTADEKTPAQLWTDRVNNFSYYNCSHETGYYPAFYVESHQGVEL